MDEENECVVGGIRSNVRNSLTSDDGYYGDYENEKSRKLQKTDKTLTPYQRARRNGAGPRVIIYSY